MRRRGDTRIWYVKVPPWLDEALEQLVVGLGYSTKSELIRELVRRECERRGMELKVAAREV